MDNLMKCAIVCCSDTRSRSEQPEIDNLIFSLNRIGINTVTGKYLFSDGTNRFAEPQKRAEELMHFYGDKSVNVIFDISGGNLSNEILPYLDYEVISISDKLFWGYSDLTALINAIYTKTKKPSVLYSVRNIVGTESEFQTESMKKYFTNSDLQLFHFHYDFICGESMRGIVVGGNIRCFLKLAGTPYFPDMNGKILFLEARSGELPLIASFFAQLRQMGVFEQINGILLGTFTQIDRAAKRSCLTEKILAVTEGKLPVAQTQEIGHGSDSKAIVIGKELILGK